MKKLLFIELILLFVLADAFAQTPVPQGCADITIGAGGANRSVQIKNTTGKKVNNVTVTIYSSTPNPNPPPATLPPGADITGLDISDVDHTDTQGHHHTNPPDHVDDNHNGTLDGAETDNAGPAGPSQTTIIPDNQPQIENNDVVTVDITLTGPTTDPNTKIKVCFSEKHNGKEYDLCAVYNLNDNALCALVEVPTGVAFVSTDITNTTTHPISNLSITPSAGSTIAGLAVDNANTSFTPTSGSAYFPATLAVNATAHVYVQLSAASDGSATLNVCDTFTIPTLSQWGIIIFALILLTTSIIFIRKRQLALAGYTDDNNSLVTRFRNARYVRMLMLCIGAAAAFLGIQKFLNGSVTSVDAFGSMITALILSVLVYIITEPHRKIDSD